MPFISFIVYFTHITNIFFNIFRKFIIISITEIMREMLMT